MDDNAQPPKRKLGELRRLGRFLIPYRLYVIGALVALTVAAAVVHYWMKFLIQICAFPKF